LIALWIKLARTRSILSASMRTTGRLDGTPRCTGRSPSKPRIRWSAPPTTDAGWVNTRSARGPMLPSGVPVARSDSTSRASRSVSTSISARNSLRVSSSHSTSVRRKLVTNPLMWLSGNRSSCAVAARIFSVQGRAVVAPVVIIRTSGLELEFDFTRIACRKHLRPNGRNPGGPRAHRYAAAIDACTHAW
jgi:hypothetical protein